MHIQCQKIEREKKNDLILFVCVRDLFYCLVKIEFSYYLMLKKIDTKCKIEVRRENSKFYRNIEVPKMKANSSPAETNVTVRINA